MEGILGIILNILLFITLYVQVLFLVTFLEKRKTLENPRVKLLPTLSFYPSVTILVPCYNEEKTLGATISSLLNLNYPKEKLEILIIDDGSTDKTLRVARKFKNNDQVRYFHKKNGGKYTALNFGLTKAKGELIGCLDADSFVEPDALIQIVKRFEDQKIMAVTPSVRVHNPLNLLQKIQKVEYDNGVFLRKMFGELNAIPITPGPFSIFRKKVFDDLGGYREAHNTEDMEIALRMHKNHYKIANIHLAPVHTVSPVSFKKLLKQRVRWVYGFLMNSLDYRELFFNKKYGHLGMFTLPAGLFSIFAVLYFVFLSFWTMGVMAAHKLEEWRIVGLPSEWNGFHFDWFFLDTGLTSIVIYILLATTLTFVLIGRWLSEGNIRFRTDIMYFLMFYGFIAPTWLFLAVWRFVIRKPAAWR